MTTPTVRFAILGTARIARTVAPKIQTTDGAEVIGIASRSQESATAFAEEFGIPRTYDNYQAAIDDCDVDAVYIPLPPSLHCEWVIRAAEAGKHVLCEKPLARNAAEVERMISACHKAQVVLLDGVMWYHTSRCAAIRRAVADETLGELRQIHAAFTFYWDTMPMDNLRLHRETGGGALLDLGWYCIGVCLLLFGERPHSVFGRAKWCNDVDTRMNALLWFSNNRTATIECGFDAVRRRWFEVAATRGSLQCQDFTRPWNAERPGYTTVDGDGRVQETVVGHPPQEQCMVSAFCELIRNRTIDHSWLHLSRDTQFVCDAIDRSAREESTVHLSTNIDNQSEVTL